MRHRRLILITGKFVVTCNRPLGRQPLEAFCALSIVRLLPTDQATEVGYALQLPR